MWVAGQFQSPPKHNDSIEKYTNYLDPVFFLIFDKASSVQKMKTFLFDEYIVSRLAIAKSNIVILPPL